MKILQKLDSFLAQFHIFLIKIYQKTISPDKGIFSPVLKGTICAHHPHCSEYSIRTLKRYGFISGIGKIMNRITSCTPSNTIQYDPEYYQVIFFSSAPIGVPFLEELAKDKRFDIVGIVTNPDQKSGRGMQLKKNIIKQKGEEIFSSTQDNIKIIPYENKYREEYARLYEICFDAPKFGVGYDYQYGYNNIKKWSNQKEYIGKILSINGIVSGFFNMFKTKNIKIYFDEIFGGIQKIKELFNKQNINIEEDAYRLDDIAISPEQRGKGYFDILLNDIYTECIQKGIQYLTIYTTKDLVKKYEKREFKVLGSIKNKDQVEYFFMMKDLNTSQNNTSDFIQTPNSLRLDSKKYQEEAKQFKSRLEKKNPDYLVVIAYGKIIPQYILNIPNIAPINIHGSLLPKYRGASPIQSIFLNQEKETGITIMKMDATMDTGNMIDKKKFKINFSDTVVEVIDTMKTIGPKFLTKTLWNYGKKLLGEEQQEENQAKYCQKIEKSDGQISIQEESLEKIYAKYRAYYLWPRIFFIQKKNGKNISCIIEHITIDESKYNKEKDRPFLINGKLNPAVQEIKIKPEGKKTMDRKSFQNGYL